MEPCSPKELLIIDKLRSSIGHLNLSPESLHQRNLVRWLRARNHNLKDAEDMIHKNVIWKKEAEIIRIWDPCPAIEEFSQAFPFNMTGFDLQGCPVFVSPLGKWDLQKAMGDGRKDDVIRYSYFLLERAEMVVQKLSQTKESLQQFVVIYDMEGLALRQLTCPDVDAILKSTKVFEANYPELMKCAIILNAPWVFQILWKLVRPFISERTHSKVIFLGSDPQVWKEGIGKRVPQEEFPERYGGTGDNHSNIQVQKDGSWSRSA